MESWGCFSKGAGVIPNWYVGVWEEWGTCQRANESHCVICGGLSCWVEGGPGLNFCVVLRRSQGINCSVMTFLSCCSDRFHSSAAPANGFLLNALSWVIDGGSGLPSEHDVLLEAVAPKVAVAGLAVAAAVHTCNHVVLAGLVGRNNTHAESMALQRNSY